MRFDSHTHCAYVRWDDDDSNCGSLGGGSGGGDDHKQSHSQSQKQLQSSSVSASASSSLPGYYVGFNGLHRLQHLHANVGRAYRDLASLALWSKRLVALSRPGMSLAPAGMAYGTSSPSGRATASASPTALAPPLLPDSNLSAGGGLAPAASPVETAAQARLFNPHGHWSPAVASRAPKPFLQIDLGSVVGVRGVALQGACTGAFDAAGGAQRGFVTSVGLAYSEDGVTFFPFNGAGSGGNVGAAVAALSATSSSGGAAPVASSSPALLSLAASAAALVDSNANGDDDDLGDDEHSAKAVLKTEEGQNGGVVLNRDFQVVHYGPSSFSSSSGNGSASEGDYPVPVLADGPNSVTRMLQAGCDACTYPRTRVLLFLLMAFVFSLSSPALCFGSFCLLVYCSVLVFNHDRKTCTISLEINDASLFLISCTSAFDTRKRMYARLNTHTHTHARLARSLACVRAFALSHAYTHARIHACTHRIACSHVRVDPHGALQQRPRPALHGQIRLFRHRRGRLVSAQVDFSACRGRLGAPAQGRDRLCFALGARHCLLLARLRPLHLARHISVHGACRRVQRR